MDLRKLQRVVVDALEDVKGQDIRVFNTSGMSDLFERVIIASGSSNRQTRALAARVRESVKEAGGDVISMEGDDTGEWVLVDLGDAVVHIMQPAIRQYYNLEEIWGAKPVRMKLGGAAVAAGNAARFASEDAGTTVDGPDLRPLQAAPEPATEGAGLKRLRPTRSSGGGAGEVAPARKRSGPGSRSSSTRGPGGSTRGR